VWYVSVPHTEDNIYDTESDLLQIVSWTNG